MTTSTIAGKSKQKHRILRRAAVLLFWAAVWQLVYCVVGQEILVASPAQVVRRLVELIPTAVFWQTTGLSLARIMAGFLIAVAGGTVLAVATTAVPLLYDLFYPVISIAKATPVASFIILALVWIQAPRVPSFAVVVMVLPILWANVSEGIRETDRDLLEMARFFRFGRLKTVRRVYLPSVFPYFMAGCTTGVGIAWKAGIAAEVLSVPRHAIGTQLYNAKIYIDTADLFAWTLLIILLSIVIEQLLVRLMQGATRRFVRQ